MLNLTNVVVFDCETYLLIGVAISLVGFLFTKLMKFYCNDIHQHVLKSDKNLIVFRPDTKVLHHITITYLVKIWVELSEYCISCILELVMKL